MLSLVPALFLALLITPQTTATTLYKCHSHTCYVLPTEMDNLELHRTNEDAYKDLHCFNEANYNKSAIEVDCERGCQYELHLMDDWMIKRDCWEKESPLTDFNPVNDAGFINKRNGCDLVKIRDSVPYDAYVCVCQDHGKVCNEKNAGFHHKIQEVQSVGARIGQSAETICALYVLSLAMVPN